MSRQTDAVETKKSTDSKVKFDVTLSAEQKIAKENILAKPYSIILGEAGSGKTFLAAHVALDLLTKKSINKIILTRPTVSTEDNGFIPGDIMQKIEPWIAPIIDNMLNIYRHPDQISKYLMDKRIEIVPLTYYRGRTFSNAVCILDEFQNMTVEQFKMAVGRLGHNSMMIFTGSKTQIDLPPRSKSAILSIPYIEPSEYVYITELMDNHRNYAVKSVLELLNTYPG